MTDKEYLAAYQIDEMSDEVKRYCKAAVQVQDACNLSGVVFDFAKAMHAICDDDNRLHKGTDWKNRHPVAVLFASKIASLTGCEVGLEFSKAYAVANNVIERGRVA